MFCIHLPTFPSTCSCAGLWHSCVSLGSSRYSWICGAQTEPQQPQTLCVTLISGAGAGSALLADCAKGLCGPGIVKAACPCDATHQSKSIPAQQGGQAPGPRAAFCVPFLLSGGIQTVWELLASPWVPVPACQGPSSPLCEVWGAPGALGTAARALLAAAQQ